MKGKKELLKDLKNIKKAALGEPICFVGDFNCVREARERMNCEYRSADSVHFNDFIQGCNLMDLEPHNSTFTWFGRDGKWSKLDRFLLDSGWFSKCQWMVQALGIKHSDHKALLLSVEEKNWGGKPFKFFNWWLQDAECIKVIQNFLQDRKITEDSLDEQNVWSHDSVLYRNELLKCYANKDSMLRQKARINWTIQGDRNTKFFNQKIQRRAYGNVIRKIFWKDKCFTHPVSIKSIFFNYFRDFFTKDSGPRVFSIGRLISKLLGDQDRLALEAPFCLQEIEVALKQSTNDKSPGPDGINFGCLKFLWPSIKGKILECFKDFEEKDCIPPGKWVFNWYKDRDKDWNKWLRAKYSSNPSEGLEDLSLSNKSSELVKSLVLLLQSSRLGEYLKIDKFKWKVNNGRSLFFWEDSWFEGEPLKVKFKRLYLLSKLKHVEVGVFIDLWDCYNKEGSVFWSRSLRNWEKSLMEQLNDVILQTPLNNKSDVVIWKGNSNTYKPKEGVELLTASIRQDCSFNRIWMQKVPPKVQLFMWKVLNGIVPSKALLFHRLGNFIENRNCDLCMVQLEDLNHILWECTTAIQTWRKVLDWWGFHLRPIFKCLNETWVAASWYKELELKQVWEIVLVATLWTLWLNRNQRLFNSSRVSLEGIVKLIKVRSQEWALERNIILEDALIWWESNPIGVVTKSQVIKVEKLFKCDCELVCFSDGAWKINDKGVMKSGIGGVIKSSEGLTKLIFSGPSSAVNAFDSELKSFEELIALLRTDFRKDLRIMCYTDCSELVSTLEKLKDFRETNVFSDSKVLDFFLEANISVTKIDRIYLQEADYWAKQGRFRASLLVNRFKVGPNLVGNCSVSEKSYFVV
ncbi:hypothetical protein POM88_044979 [Heracleum sosnowskyi]|uniref:Reverse transcriptase zinc-binding domain-containing protein n=1 Tax=Heracleum sosnowskyi TaxID=360622 RepID=A0AAD8H6H9_9APIA|nr:hypothetical protein POM88_044979 [Heracleum sosnowskyi]